jgi:GNAT superfamily N-acetyltransferase
MNYRFATRDDAPLLASLNQQLIQDEGHANPMTLAELERRMAGWLDGDYQAVLFSHQGHAAGYALFRPTPEYVYLRHFFVCRHHRRQGIGRAAITWLRNQVWAGAARIRLDVLAHNTTGIAFWRAVGFRDYCLTLEWKPADAATPN